uniref:Calmodulin-interacting protein 111 isoform X2 n=1 Tax=Rhizophora mucronata TaxID=61149 RepID=A0A2P2LBN8_RHIMU
MPSKKKHSKVASRLSKTDQSASPHTPALTSPSKFEVNEQDHALLLEEASHIYPLLIGTSAFVGHLTDIVVEQELTRRGTIWLSESAMVASSCAPGCVVSVIYYQTFYLRIFIDWECGSMKIADKLSRYYC